MSIRTEPLLVRAVAWAVGLWLRRFDVHGIDAVREGYRRLLVKRGPILLCASHESLADGPLLWWALAAVKAPYVVTDVSLFPRWFAPFALFRTVAVRQGAGLAPATRAKLAELVRRGETVLIFPKGTREEPFSYLVGALLSEFSELRVGLIQLKTAPLSESWRIPRLGTRFDLNWAVMKKPEGGEGLHGIRERALKVTSELEALPC